MARPSSPWFRSSKNTWYCTLDGKKVSRKVKGEGNERETIKAWHRLFARMPLARLVSFFEPSADQ